MTFLAKTCSRRWNIWDHFGAFPGPVDDFPSQDLLQEVEYLGGRQIYDLRVVIGIHEVLEHLDGPLKERHPQDENSIKELRLSGDQLARVEDEFLLEDSADDVVRLYLGVESLVDVLRSAGPVKLLEVDALGAHSQFLSIDDDLRDVRTDGVNELLQERGGVPEGRPIPASACLSVHHLQPLSHRQLGLQEEVRPLPPQQDPQQLDAAVNVRQVSQHLQDVRSVGVAVLAGKVGQVFLDLRNFWDLRQALVAEVVSVQFLNRSVSRFCRDFIAGHGVEVLDTTAGEKVLQSAQSDLHTVNGSLPQLREEVRDDNKLGVLHVVLGYEDTEGRPTVQPPALTDELKLGLDICGEKLHVVGEVKLRGTEYQRIAEHRLPRHSIEFTGSQGSQGPDRSSTQLQLLALPHRGEHLDQLPRRPDLNRLHLCGGLGEDPVVGQHALEPGGL